jgi:hypothetical protein
MTKPQPTQKLAEDIKTALKGELDRKVGSW